MKKISGFKFFILSFVVIVLIGLVAGSAYATNGYFSHGYGLKDKAMAGAGTALALDSMSAATNPASMAFVGDSVDVSISFHNPNRQYTVTGAPSNAPGTRALAVGTVESGTEWFFIPALGYNRMMNDNYSLGVAIFGNGGMNTDYSTNTYGGSNPTGVDMMQLFIAPTYARKLNDKHAIGVSPVIGYQRFLANGMESFANMSNESTKLSNNGHDSAYGIGVRVGYMGEVATGLHVGASYQTKIYMDEWDRYAGLFAEHGDFDVPATWNIGVAYDITPELTVAVDMQEIYYSDVKSIGNTFNPAFNTCAAVAQGAGGTVSGTPQCLGNDQGVGYGWEDMTIIKTGVQWASNEEWTWRAGYSYAEQPIGESEVMFNMIAPGVIEQHITGGLTKKFTDNQKLDIAIMRGLSNSVTGPNPNDPPNAGGTGQMIELEMDQWEFSVGYSKSF